jgi:hypothetical protein
MRLRREGSLGYFEVLLEQVLHEVKTVAEGHEVLRNEIKASHKELEDKIDLNSSVMRFGFETLDAKIDGVQTELRETRVDLSARIEAVGAKVNSEGREGALVCQERMA